MSLTQILAKKTVFVQALTNNPRKGLEVMLNGKKKPKRRCGRPKSVEGTARPRNQRKIAPHQEQNPSCFMATIIGIISKRHHAHHSTTQTVQFRAWFTILLEILPKRNSSLRESPCRPTTMVLYCVSFCSAKIHSDREGQYRRVDRTHISSGSKPSRINI